MLICYYFVDAVHQVMTSNEDHDLPLELKERM